MVLQRVLVDFGAEESFSRATKQVKEHYGIDVPISTIRATTLKHAGYMAEEEKKQPKVRTLKGKGKKVIVTEMDGTMLPMVRTKAKAGDKRRGRKVYWSEARLGVACAQGRIQKHYTVCFGDTDTAGEKWAQVADKAGWGTESQIHAIGDGAPWIEKQSTLQFGAQGNYLLDFYHVCEYLGAAAKEGMGKNKKRRLKEQKKRLKAGKTQEVIATLKKLAAEGNAAEKAYKYMEKRKAQLDYKSALEAELPIGSGLIESGHRHVLQKRLKLSGGWWAPDNIERMGQLRVVRANEEWDHYRQSLPYKKAA